MKPLSNNISEDDALLGRMLVIRNSVNPFFSTNVDPLGLIREYIGSFETSTVSLKTTYTTIAFVSNTEALDTGAPSTFNHSYLYQASVSISRNSILPTLSPHISFPIEIGTQNTTSHLRYDGSPYPLFCSRETAKECQNTTLFACGACDMRQAILIATVVLLLGIAIIFGNSLIFAVMVQRRKKKKLENMDLHRISLAAADLLTGIQLVTVFLYNFIRTLTSTARDNHASYFNFLGSREAAIGGVFLLLTFTSSLYNLIYLAGQMLYAFVKPIQYKIQQKRTISRVLAAIWLLALASSTIFTWFPQDFTPAYIPTIFLFFSELKVSANQTVSIPILILFYFVPYLINVFLLIASAVVMRFRVRRSTKTVARYSGRKVSSVPSIREIQYFVTVVLMEIGFTLTLLPSFVVVLYIHLNPAVSYAIVAPAYAATFYLAMSNSLVNVAVFSIRDSKFRTSVADVFANCCPSFPRYNPASPSRNEQKIWKSDCSTSSTQVNPKTTSEVFSNHPTFKQPSSTRH